MTFKRARALYFSLKLRGFQISYSVVQARSRAQRIALEVKVKAMISAPVIETSQVEKSFTNLNETRDETVDMQQNLKFGSKLSPET